MSPALICFGNGSVEKLAKKAAPVTESPEATPDEEADPLATTLVMGASDSNQSETIAIRENLTAAIPGIKFKGAICEQRRTG